ncbi:esterase [Caudovirales GX15bay]|nr:esterase [Caudovirales GX15bay]
MTGITRRFGFTTLGEDDDFDANDYAFSRENRIRLDKIITETIERHRHTGAASSLEVPSAPTLTMEPAGGTFAPNSTITYRYGYVDTDGQESVASTPASIVTTQTVTAPEPATLSQDTGGFLLPGPYSYLLTAYTGESIYETTPSRPVTGTLTAETWTLTFPSLPAGADGWNIYRKGPTDTEPIYLTSSVDESLLDDGSIAPNVYRVAPTANTTSTTSSVTVDLSDGLPPGHTWRIYRTTDQSDWSQSLVVQASEAPYSDTGHATLTGSPASTSTAIGFAPKIPLGSGTFGQPPPAMVLVPRIATFTQKGELDVGILPWVWLCEYDAAKIVAARAALGKDATPTGTAVVAQVEYDTGGGWTSIGVDLEISAGDSASPLYDASNSGLVETLLGSGDRLRAKVTGVGSSPRTDFDLAITVTLIVQQGSDVTSYAWEAD